MQLVSGLPLDRIDRNEFWQRVAFSNLATTQATASREAAPDHGYQLGAQLFPRILDMVRPDFVLTFGDRVWDALEADRVLVSFGERDGGYWAAQIGDIPVYHSRHPSGRFSWRTWSALLGRFLSASGHDVERITCFVDQFVRDDHSELLAGALA